MSGARLSNILLHVVVSNAVLVAWVETRTYEFELGCHHTDYARALCNAF